MFKFIIAMALSVLLCAAFTDGVFTLTSEELVHKPVLSLVPEMEMVPEADTWAACAADEAPSIKEEWVKLAPWVGVHVTPEVAKGLSRWAQPKMEKYNLVPSFEKLSFSPVTCDKKHGVIAYEAIVDNLPVHSQLVTRQLVLYVVYSTELKKITRVTITIRGHVEE